MCCAACEEEWQVRRMSVCALGPGSGGAGMAGAYPLIYTILCAVLLLGLSMGLLTLVVLPPWVPRSTLVIALVLDLATLVGLLSPAGIALGQRAVLGLARRAFMRQAGDAVRPG